MKTSSSSAILSLSLFPVFIISLPPPLAAVRCNPADKAVLLKIKAALNNPYALASWDPNTDCCYWYTVKCDSKTNRIISLTIFDDNLAGQIPAAIGDLPYLQMIDLNRLPNLTGAIPSTITKLTNLNFLRLQGNKLSGPIPTALGNLKKLTFVDLSSNQLSGSIPASVTQLTNLDTIRFDNNNLCGPIPQGGKLQNTDVASYDNNKCLCGAPLPACKK